MSLLAALALSGIVGISDADIAKRRARIPNNIAQAIAGELYPDACGGRGELCGIIYDERRACPNEFVIQVPKERTPARPRWTWVTLDNRGKVISMTTNPRSACPDSSI